MKYLITGALIALISCMSKSQAIFDDSMGPNSISK